MNSKAWDFLSVLAVLLFLYLIIEKVIPHCKELSLETGPDGKMKFTALTHDKEELADAAPPLVLQGN